MSGRTRTERNAAFQWRVRLLCLAVIAPAPLVAQSKPLDLIVAVDSSGSMVDDVGKVRDGLNTFVASLATAGHDVRLVLISAGSSSSVGICVPAPLGSGSCPTDERLPSYLHVAGSVDSGFALQKILATHGSWRSFLREGSRRSLVVVSDDDSELRAADFVERLVSLDRGFAGFQFHAVAASTQGTFVDANPGPCDCLVTDHGCEIPSAAEGTEYRRLVEERHGVFFDLCEEDWGQAWTMIVRRIDEVIFFGGFETGDVASWSSSARGAQQDGQRKPGS